MVMTAMMTGQWRWQRRSPTLWLDRWLKRGLGTWDGHCAVVRPDINSFVMMIKRMVLVVSSLIAIKAWTLDVENSQMGGTMLVDEKRVHPEVEQLSVVHISWPVQQFSIYAWGFSSCLPAHDVHDVQLDFLSEINLDVADYQQRVLIAKQIINSVYF